MYIHRYRIKQGAVPPKGNDVIEGQSMVRLSDDGSVTLVKDFTHNLPPDTGDKNFDLDFFLVLDELVCQPYSVFYSYLDYDVIDGENCSPFILGIIKKYNQTMDKINWLERVR